MWKRICALFIVASCCGPGDTFGRDRPNFVIILADDLGYGDLACYGNEANQTPHLDRMAAEGLRFTDFHSNGPMCSATRAALLTGRYQQRFGRHFEGALSQMNEHDGLPLNAVTIADALQDAGYATGMYGKWHLGFQPPLMPTQQGFDDFRGLVTGGGDHHSHINRSGGKDWWHNNEIEMEEGYSTDLITQHSQEFIRQHKDEPFFLYVAHLAIHFPWQGPEDEGYRVEGQSYWGNKHGVPSGSNVGPVSRSMIEALDSSVGKILGTLKELDLDEDTFVIFTSDNGGYLTYSGGFHNISSNGPFRGQKTEIFEGGHRVPAIVLWPGKVKPGVTHQTTATFDLFPTFLELAGLDEQVEPLDLDGTSLTSLLSDGEPLEDRPLFWRIRHHRAVRQGPWKLVALGDDVSLYNLDEAMDESHDVAPANGRLVAELQEKLADWEADIDGTQSHAKSESSRDELEYEVELTTATNGFDGDYCWVHARAGAIPPQAPGNPNDDPLVVMTTQKLLLTGSDVFYALNQLTTEDGGQMWTEPQPLESFGRQTYTGNEPFPTGAEVATELLEPGDETTVCDFTPKWHASSQKLLGTGHTVWYRNNRVTHVRPRGTAYAVFDPDSRTWTKWRTIDMPDEPRFQNAGAGCVQRLDLPNGEILLPIYFKEPHSKLSSVTVLRCVFDGETLSYVEHGNEMSVDVPRGLGEPSLTKFSDRYFLTLRNDEQGYVTSSGDGLHFDEPRPWAFDDGTNLGSYNTQQHWVTHSHGLFLVYTRRGADNDHVFRHRAPLFIARVDPEKLHVIRDTERILVPERGARLGNFGVVDVSPDETWVTVTEWMQPKGVEKYGSDNSIFVARLKWNRPNQ